MKRLFVTLALFLSACAANNSPPITAAQEPSLFAEKVYLYCPYDTPAQESHIFPPAVTPVLADRKRCYSNLPTFESPCTVLVNPEVYKPGHLTIATDFVNSCAGSILEINDGSH